VETVQSLLTADLGAVAGRSKARRALRPRSEVWIAFALLGTSLAAGLLFGSSATLPVNDARFIGFNRDLSSFNVVLLVNALSVTIILIGVLTGGLLSALFTSILGTLLGAETALIIKSEGLLTMLAVTGPHAIFELTGFGFALAAGLVPLTSWGRQVRRGANPMQGFRGGIRRVVTYALVAYALVLVGAGVEVVGIFVPR
jgi:uncharacterized membrane protein SpoIIM required for sporulation